VICEAPHNKAFFLVNAVTFTPLPVNPLTEDETRKADASSHGKQLQAGGSRDEVRREEGISFDPL
jgi:hypothetical protein